jgi:hypothetical protein
METQRVEAARKRRIEETERRNLQQRTSKHQKTLTEKKVHARIMAKEFLKGFKTDTHSILTD